MWGLGMWGSDVGCMGGWVDGVGVLALSQLCVWASSYHPKPGSVSQSVQSFSFFFFFFLLLLSFLLLFVLATIACSLFAGVLD